MPLIALYIIEFILVSAAAFFLERILQVEKARQENFQKEQIKRAMVSEDRIKCLKLEEELRAIQRNIDFNNAKYSQFRSDIDKLNRRRMDLEDIYDDVKRRIQGIKYLGAQERAVVVRQLNSQATSVRATYGPLLIGALITLGTAISTFLFEIIQSNRAAEARLREIQNLPSQCNCDFTLESSGGDDFIQVYSIVPKPENTVISISFTAYTVADRLIISVDGNIIYDSGCVGEGEGGNGQSSVSATATLPANSNVMTVQVLAECGAETGSIWDLSIGNICIID